MYKIDYTKLAILDDGSKGNISQGNDTAYMHCAISEIDANLCFCLSKQSNKKRYHPVINNIEKISGHIVVI